jgi:hypothetical protein
VLSRSTPWRRLRGVEVVQLLLRGGAGRDNLITGRRMNFIFSYYFAKNSNRTLSIFLSSWSYTLQSRVHFCAFCHAHVAITFGSQRARSTLLSVFQRTSQDVTSRHRSKCGRVSVRVSQLHNCLPSRPIYTRISLLFSFILFVECNFAVEWLLASCL